MATGSQSRKADILTAAFKALRADGLPMLSYDSIARHGTVSRQLVRYHYPDAETLMIDVCDHLAGLYREALICEVMNAKGRERLDIFFDFYFDLLDDNRKPRDDEVYDALMSLSASSTRIRTTLRNQYGLLGQVLSYELELEYPALGAQAAQELSWLFVCLMYGHWKMVASLGFSEAHRLIGREAIERLLKSYLASGPAARNPPRVWQTAT